MLNMREYVAWVVGLAGVPFSGGRGGGAPEYQRPVPLQRLAQQPAASSTKRCYTPSRKTKPRECTLTALFMQVNACVAR